VNDVRPRSRRPVVLAMAGATAVVLVVLVALIVHDPATGTGTAGEASRPWPDQSRSADTTVEAPALPAGPRQQRAEDDASIEDGRGADLPPLADTTDPDAYAVMVAEVLFGMEHANHDPGDYEAFLAAALWDEITDSDRGRIMATIARRIPTVDMWEQMRSVDQAAEFDVELVWEPRSARAHRERGDWPDGWEMRTVSGTQTETWRAPGEPAQSSTRPVAVTVAMACPPAAARCALIGVLPHVES
jgi:hypothetical protein